MKNYKPTYQWFYKNGQLEYQAWYKNGQRYRDNDKPAFQGFYDNGNIWHQEWYKNEQLHRDNDKPAFQGFYDNGNIWHQEWYKNEQLHRDGNKPARVWYEKGGNMKVKKREWYKYGVKVTEEFCKNREWEKMTPQEILSEPNAQRRMMLIQLVGIEKVAEGAEILEEIKGTELYRRYPIGDYYQQGDVLLKSKPVARVEFDDMDEKTKVRLSNIVYRLIKIDKFKYLQMSNPSHSELTHIEGVKDNIESVFDAICFRNQEDCLPMELT